MPRPSDKTRPLTVYAPNELAAWAAAVAASEGRSLNQLVVGLLEKAREESDG